ncbi:MAG TPA: NYN domain-containing protein [Candidatus Atribacteria bacterium]|nr:NYN domain-containing protein [Candidatus Atribacteria bacterium]
MEEILLIDGYNIINSWPELKKAAGYSLEEARRLLLDIMQDYQGYRGIRVIVVFDAHMIKGGREKTEYAGGVEVVYTGENETADHYIERWTDSIQKNMQVTVATSDALQQTIVLSRGAVRMSARELLERVRQAKREMDDQYLEKPRPKSNTLGDWADPATIRILERWRRNNS